MPKTRRLPLDEARLLPHLRRTDERVFSPIEMLEPASAFGALTVSRVTKTKLVPSPGELRGVPVTGHGGTQPGSDPLQAWLDKERRLNKQAA